jgi:hypothetical protein
MLRISRVQSLIGFVVILVLGVTLLFMTSAQDNPAGMTVTGTVEAINGTTIVVSGANVDLSQANITIPNLQVGVVVQITGSFSNGVIIATTIVILNPTIEATPEMTATPVPESTVSVTPALTPTVNGDPIIVIEGPVQSINVNIITIFNINIQVDSNDPILTQIQIGDNLHVEGHAVSQGNTIIIVAINITIVNVIVVNPPQDSPGVPPNCKITPKGHIKCTKRHH